MQHLEATHSFNELDFHHFNGPVLAPKTELTAHETAAVIISADQLNRWQINTHITEDKASILRDVSEILADLKKVCDSPSQESLELEKERQTLVSSLLLNLHKQLEECRKMELLISFKCEHDTVPIVDEYGAYDGQAVVATLIIDRMQ